jgi:hypothetical protein
MHSLAEVLAAGARGTPAASFDHLVGAGEERV